MPGTLKISPAMTRLGQWLPWCALALGLLASGFAWNVMYQRQQQNLEIDFRARADRATVEIRKRLLAYEQILRGGAALFEANNAVSRSQWRAYVERLNISESLPGVQGIGFVKLVPDSEKAAHVTAMRAEGLAAYDIRPPGTRSTYLPVVYLEPFSNRTPRAIGFDMSTDPVRMAAMESARIQGAAAISATVRWIQESDGKEQSGFMMYLPAYRTGVPSGAVGQRDAALIGYIYAAFRMTNVVGGTLDPAGDGMDLEIFDGTDPSRDSLLFDLDKVPRFLAATAKPRLALASALDVTGRTWTLRYEALPAFAARHADGMPVLVLVCGFLLSLLLFALIWSSTRMRNSALALAEEMSVSLRENEQRFTGIFHSAMDAIISIDESNLIVHFNPAAEQIFRCTEAQALGMPLTNFMPQRFRQAHSQHVERFGATGISDRQMGRQTELFGLRADGEEFPLEASISQTTQGGRKLFTVMLRDVSARRLSEAALRNSEQRFRGLVEVSPEAICIHQDERVVFVNRSALVLFGADHPDSLVGRTIYSLFHPDSAESCRKAVASLLGGTAVVPVMERRIIRLDGETRVVEVAAGIHEDSGRTAIQEVMRDVTERHIAQAELARSHAELRKLGVALEQAQEQERKRIAQELHDDLGQTLTVLKMDMSNLKASLSVRAHDGAHLTSLAADAERMDGLLNDTVHSVRRISANLRPQLLDDLGLITALDALLKQVSRSSGIQCSLILDTERLLVDESLATPLYRIAQEALNNVVKHSHATTAVVRLSRDAAGGLKMEISDNGGGFVAEDRRKSDSFGLISMRERAYAIGGDLLVESVAGQGTNVRITIPKIRNADFPESRAAKEPGTA